MEFQARLARRRAVALVSAAHCVYGSSYASNIEFLPKYHKGQQPYGAWPVKRIFVFGVIGGYQQGGDHSWASYSANFSRPVSELFRLAGGQGQAAG